MPGRFWLALHRYTGLAMSLFLGIAALTGVVLSLVGPLDAALNPDLFGTPATRPIAPLAAVAALEARHPELTATQVPLQVAPGRSVRVSVAARPGHVIGFDELFLDTADGHVAGTRRIAPGWDRRHLAQGLFRLHTDLVAGTWGRWLLGVVALAWLVSNPVGVYLTWPPRRPYWRQWKRAWRFRLSSPWPRLLLDIHRASGLWLVLPLTVLAFTSVAMNFYDEAFMPAVRALSPPAPSPFDTPGPAAPPAIRVSLPSAGAAARRLAATRAPGWQAAVVQRDPTRGLVGVRFTRSGVEEYAGLGPITWWFDGTTGRLRYIDDPYSDSAGEKLNRSLYPLHTGQMIGLTGIVLDIVLGVATLEMIGTGIYLWLKRRKLRRPR